MLDASESQFLADGLVVVPVPELGGRLQSALSACERLIRNAERLGRIGQAKVRKSDKIEIEGHGWSWGCDHIYAPALREQALLDLVSLYPIPALVGRILGERVRFSGGHGHWSSTNYDYFLHWHRDTRRERWHLANPDPRSHIQVCIALTDEAVVRVVPGSHLRDLDSWEYRFISTAPHDDHPNQVIAEIPAGSALLLNTYAFHRAQCQKKNTRRCLHYGFTRVGSESEPGRQGKVLEWLSDPDFVSVQTPFLRACIEEQIREQSALLPPR